METKLGAPAHAGGLSRSMNGSRAPEAPRNGAVGVRSRGREGGSVVDIQRARILAAMIDVCAQRGVANVTVAHVVERAGISRRTFYDLFDDREECFLAAFDEAIARARRYLLDAYDPGAKWAMRLRGALTALLEFFDVERNLGWLLVVGSLGASMQALERRKRVLARIVAEIDTGRDEGKTSTGLAPLTAEGIVGAVFSVIHGRMVTWPTMGDAKERPLIELVNPLMSIVVMPYLGPAAARRELGKAVPASTSQPVSMSADPLRGLAMRITYRTVKVLIALAENPGSSNRQLGDAAGIGDQGQTSKLLHRLVRLGLVENIGPGPGSGERNMWALTPKGHEVEQAIAAQQG
jgi:AcrR family transcriptional regulator/DNA-binding MarR family transcriptional regulator